MFLELIHLSLIAANSSTTIERKGVGFRSNSFNSAPKCTVCAKTVYKMEEVGCYIRNAMRYKITE